LAEFERDLLRERMAAGLAAARARGRHGGRPSVMTAHKLKVAQEMYRSGEYTVAAIATTLGVSRASIYRHLDTTGYPWGNVFEEAMMAARCSFCGSTTGPFSKVEGLFTVLMCTDCQAARGYGSGPYPVMTRAEMRAGLDQLPTWALEQKAAANHQVIAVTRQRLAAGEQVPRMYQEPGLAWLERQAEVAEALVPRQATSAPGPLDLWTRGGLLPLG
jgi:hypothetical protein